MSAALEVKGLCKEYPAFRLDNVSFDLERGSIMGFIGRNGAGKTTTLKSLMNLVHPSAGEVRFFDMDFRSHEDEIKQRTGYCAGGVNYYPKKRVREIAACAGSFFSNWDDGEYKSYLERFSLDENKRLCELSEGMKVKFSLALALSHHAECLVLDEPTSGLDPVSREELLEVFMDIAEKNVAILFSTHIISDIEKCADSLTYIQRGRILASAPLDGFEKRYLMAELSGNETREQLALTLGIRRQKQGRTALINATDAPRFAGTKLASPNLEEIMSHLEAEK